MLRGKRDEKIFRIELSPRAIAASYIVFDHLDVGFRQRDLLRQDAAVEERHLRSARNGELVLGRIPLRHHPTWFHGEAVVAAGAQAFAARIGRIFERRVSIALPRFERKRPIGARGVEQHALTFRCHLPGRDRRQLLDLNGDPFQRVLAEGDARRQHHGNRLADVAHLLVGNDRLLVGLEFGQRLQSHRHDRYASRVILRRHVLGGDDGVDALDFQRAGHIDRAQPAVRHGAAQDHRIKQTGHLEIVDVGAAAAQEAQILAALDRCADIGVFHRECHIAPRVARVMAWLFCRRHGRRAPPRRSRCSRCSGRDCRTILRAPCRHRSRALQ